MKKKSEQPKNIPGRVASSGISIRRFAVTYLLLMGVFFFIIGFAPLQRIIDVNGGYTRGVVTVTSWVLRIADIPATCQGSIIRLPSIALDVKFGCNGLEAVMIYAVAVMAFPATGRRKLAGIAAGFVILQAVNILRIAGLAYAGVRFPGIFEYLHIYVAQGMMIAVALAVFFVYLGHAGPHDQAAA
ncbi:MAG: exosortase H [Nitrospiraceae bacterium]|nr:exosortase H [Nitrospiraceae bacterium]